MVAGFPVPGPHSTVAQLLHVQHNQLLHGLADNNKYKVSGNLTNPHKICTYHWYIVVVVVHYMAPLQTYLLDWFSDANPKS